MSQATTQTNAGRARARARTTRGSAGVVAAAVVVALVAVLGIAPPARAAVPVLYLTGTGHGHGVGLSQWGAWDMARRGASTTDILGQYYPGTALADGAGGEVVVAVETADRIRVRLPGGGELRSARSGSQADGFPVTVPPGGEVVISRSERGYVVDDGSVRGLGGEPVRFGAQSEDCIVLCKPDDQPDKPSEPDEPCLLCTTTTTAPPRTDPGDGSTPPPAEPEPAPPPPAKETPAEHATVSPTPVWAIPTGGSTTVLPGRERSYRGLIEISSGAGDDAPALRARNHVDIETYLHGLAEVPGNWPTSAMQAQAIAARTYALRAVALRGELCDSEACQVYGGVEAESPGRRAAADSTAGQVLLYDGRLAAAYYSASAGGFTATMEEGFGATDGLPYLPAQPEPTDEVMPWELTISLTDVADRLGYPGTLTGVRIPRTGPSGRPLEIVVEGNAGTAVMDPQEFRRALGLRSTLFDAHVGTTAAPPPPPPEAIRSDQLGSLSDTWQVRIVAPLGLDPTMGVADAADLIAALELTPLAELATPTLPAAPTAPSADGWRGGFRWDLLAIAALLAAAAGTGDRCRRVGLDFGWGGAGVRGPDWGRWSEMLRLRRR